MNLSNKLASKPLLTTAVVLLVCVFLAQIVDFIKSNIPGFHFAVGCKICFSNRSEVTLMFIFTIMSMLVANCMKCRGFYTIANALMALGFFISLAAASKLMVSGI